LGGNSQNSGHPAQNGDDNMTKFAKADLNKDGKVTMQEKILSALASYGRAFLAAALALYMAGNTDVKDLLMARTQEPLSLMKQ
jgi:hypothetical protein